jgi:hypothetical protein
MTERIAQASDEREAADFDRIRRRFILEAEKHMDQGNGIAGLANDPDSFFCHLMAQAVDAERERRPQPHPWFIQFCAGLLDEDDGTRAPPADTALN